MHKSLFRLEHRSRFSCRIWPN